MAADHRRSKVDALLEQETRQQLNPSSCSTTRLNSAWRHKVVHWYFKLVGALHRQNTTASSNNGTSRTSSNPFNRTTVHISAYLLDNYLMSLPQEQAMRYRHNRPAYQLLATTCLLLGIRIAKHDAIKSSLSSAQDVNEPPAEQSCGMKRAKKCTNMSLMSASSTDSGPSSSPPSPPGIAIPNATTILSMSAAPNSITEQNVLDMVKKLTSSRDFPRSKVVTALDYIYALSASSTQVSEEDGQSISLRPQDVEEASRIADTLLSDVNIISTPPSVVACAIITLVSRSNALNNLDMASIRQKVYYSIFGSKVDPDLQIATLRAETTVGVTAPPPRHRRPVPITTHHIIPFD